MVEEFGKILSSSGEVMLKVWETRVTPKTRIFKRHFHTNFEIALILNGSGIYNTVSGDKEFSAGDIFVFAGNEPHFITRIDPPGLRALALQFAPEYLLEQSESIHSDSFSSLCFEHSPLFKSKIPKSEAEKLSEFLFQIKAELTEKNKGYRLGVRSLLNLFLISLIREHGYLAPVLTSGEDRRRMLTVLSYIDSHFTEAITLSEIANEISVTPNYFSTLFRSYFNIGLWDYISSKRIEKAIFLLSDTEKRLTVLDIATRCGFNSTANFNKIFKNKTGLTPSEFRRGKNLISIDR